MAARRNKTILRTRADIDRAWQQLEQEIAKHRKGGEGRREAFATRNLKKISPLGVGSVIERASFFFEVA